MAAPANDLIANAQVIGKGWRDVSGTTTDATFAEELAAGYDQPSVWYQLDTKILQRVPVYVRWDCSYPIYGELYSVDTPTPNAAQLMTGIIGDYQDSFGNGNNAGANNLDVQLDGVGQGLYYFVYVSNYDFDLSEGDFDLTFCVPWSIDTGDINPDSTTASIVSGRVKDTQYGLRETGEYELLMPEELVDSMITTAPTGGKFYVAYRGRLDGTVPLFDGFGIGLSRQGYPTGIPVWEDGWTTGLTSEMKRFEFLQSPLRYSNGGSYFGSLMQQCYPLGVRSGDTIGVRLVVDAIDTPSNPPTWGPALDCATFYVPWLEQPFGGGDTTLYPDAEDPAPGMPTTWTLPQMNIGGGPELFSVTRRGFGDPEAPLVWDMAFDFVVLDDGTMYLAFHEQSSDNGSTPYDFSLCIAKWDGANWSLIDEDVWGHGTEITRYYSENVTMDLSPDENFVYIAWHEADTHSTPTSTDDEHYWRCVRLDTSDDSLTELGPSTGTTHYPNSSRERFAAWYGSGIRVRVSPAGVPWVGWCEVPTDDIDPPNGPNHNSELPFLYYWNGSAWTDSQLPEPPTMLTPWWNACLVEEPMPHVDFTFCHHDGPSETPSAVYHVQWNTIAQVNDTQWVYWECDSPGSWSNGLQKRANLIWSGAGVLTDGLWSDTVFDDGDTPYDFGHWHQGMCLLNNGSKPVLIAALGFQTNDIDYTAACTIADDGSDFEPLPDPYVTQGAAVYGSGGWFPPTTSGSVYEPVSGKFYVDNSHIFHLAQQVRGQGELGDGSGWYGIPKENTVNWENSLVYLHATRLRARAGRIYALNFNIDGVLGIWEHVPIIGGIVSMNWRSSDRRGAANRVLMG